MIVHAAGHWDGDPEEHCGELAVSAEGLGESKRLAVLFRVLKDGELRERLIEAAREIERQRPATAAQWRQCFPTTC